MNTQNFDALFKPESIAIYGASHSPIKVGGRPLRYLLEQEYAGNIYPINPKHTSLQGVRCYADVEQIPFGVDLVIIAVPASASYEALERCAKHGIKSAVILTAGFGEMGALGKALQDRITGLADSYGMRILGPNCLGMMNVIKKTPATFASILERRDIRPGNVAVISQSGAFGNHILGMAYDMKLGVSYWITTGNEADIQLNDCIEYVAEDEQTDVIAGYIEDVRDGEKFMMALDRCLEKEKPVVLCKVGKTASGSYAAQSHTGALAGNYQVYEAVFGQKGVIQAESLYEMMDYSDVLSRKTSVRGNGIAVVSISGGAGVMIADKSEECGLRMAYFGDATLSALESTLPVFASVKNPVDITAQAVADPTLFGNAVNICLRDEDTDAVIIYLGALDDTGPRIAQRIIEVVHGTDKPVAVTWVSGPKEATDMLKAAGVMVFDEPMRCVNALGKLIEYRLFINEYKGRPIEKQTNSTEHGELIKWLRGIASQRKVLSEYEARRVLVEFGIPVVEGEIANTVEDAVRIAKVMGYPVVLKINSPDIPHKSDVGGVRLNLGNEREVREAYAQIIESTCKVLGDGVQLDGMLVLRMEQAEAETIIGLKHDVVFGHTLMFGLGGIFVEVCRDVALRVTPIERWEAEDMVESVKAINLLDGVRGGKACDKKAIADILVKTARLAEDLSDVVAELDINPLLVFEKGYGVKAGDALIVLQ